MYWILIDEEAGKAWLKDSLDEALSHAAKRLLKWRNAEDLPNIYITEFNTMDGLYSTDEILALLAEDD